MENRFKSVCAGVLIITLLTAVLYPQELWAFFDEDTLKTTGIIIGITFGVCLVIVLIAGTMKDLKGDPEDVFARLPIQKPDGPWKDLFSLTGKAPDPSDVIFMHRKGCFPDKDPILKHHGGLRGIPRKSLVSLSGDSGVIPPLYPCVDGEKQQGNARQMTQKFPYRLCVGQTWMESETSFLF